MSKVDTCNEWNTTTEEAKRLKVSPRTLIRRRQARKGPPWYEVDGRIYYNPKATDEYMEKHRREPVAEVSE